MPLARILFLTGLLLVTAATAQEPGEVATLRVLHLSPDAPLVDVTVEGRLHVRNLGIRDRSALLILPAGRHEIRVYPHRLPDAAEDDLGTTEGAARDDLAEGNGTNDASADERDVAGSDARAGDAATPEATPRSRPRSLEAVTAVVDLEVGSYTTLVLTGNFELPTAEDQRGHLSIDVEPPEATITVTGPQGLRVQRTGDQLLADLEPGAYEAEVQLEGYQPAVYGVDVAGGGTTVVTVALQEADGQEDEEEEEEEEVATTFQEPDEAQGGWRALELQPYSGRLPLPAPARALVRFIHAAPTVPNMEIRTTAAGRTATDDDGEAGEGSDDASATDDPPLVMIDLLAYPNASEYLDVPAGLHGLEFRVAGTDSVVYTLPEVHLRPGFTYTLFLAAGPTNGEIWIVPSVDAAIPQRAPVSGFP